MDWSRLQLEVEMSMMNLNTVKLMLITQAFWWFQNNALLPLCDMHRFSYTNTNEDYSWSTMDIHA